MPSEKDEGAQAPEAQGVVIADNPLGEAGSEEINWDFHDPGRQMAKDYGPLNLPSLEEIERRLTGLTNILDSGNFLVRPEITTELPAKRLRVEPFQYRQRLDGSHPFKKIYPDDGILSYRFQATLTKGEEGHPDDDFLSERIKAILMEHKKLPGAGYGPVPVNFDRFINIPSDVTAEAREKPRGLPVTINALFMKHLVDRGLFPDQAEKILEIARARPIGAMMAGRWDDQPGDYPTMLIQALTKDIDLAAIAWFDEHFPQHWARSLFTDTGQEPST